MGREYLQGTEKWQYLLEVGAGGNHARAEILLMESFMGQRDFCCIFSAVKIRSLHSPPNNITSVYLT